MKIQAVETHDAGQVDLATLPERAGVLPDAVHCAPETFVPPRVTPPAEWPSSRLRFFFMIIDNFMSVWPRKAYDGAIVDCSKFAKNVFIVNDPRAIERIFVSNRNAYDVSWRQAKMCKSLFGKDSIALSLRDRWQRQRPMFSRALDRTHVERKLPVLTRHAAALAEQWRGHVGRPIRVDQEYVNFSFQAIAAMALSWCDSAYIRTLAKQLTAVRDSVGKVGFGAFFASFDFVPVAARGKSHRLLAGLGKRIGTAITDRTAAGDFGDDFLGLYLNRRAIAPDEKITDAEIVSNVITLFASGYDTTATTMSWMSYLLSRSPHWQAAVRKELQQALAAGGEFQHFAASKIPNTQAVFSETVRLYPPLPLLAREALEDDVIGGQPIARGATLLVSPYILHRHSAFWRDPDQFDPQRFLAGTAEPVPDMAYMPFGAGERTCAGFHLSRFEVLMMMAQILTRYSLQPDEQHEIELCSRMGLRMRNGIQLYATPLEQPG